MVTVFIIFFILLNLAIICNAFGLFSSNSNPLSDILERDIHDYEFEKQQISGEIETKQDKESSSFETNTIYFLKITEAFKNNPNSFSFDTILNLSSRQGVWDELENGLAKLSTYEQLEEYIYSYGKMHKAKLENAFTELLDKEGSNLANQPFEIIDYGCGQGIGTIVFIDVFKAYLGKEFSVNKVKLIEPSIVALNRAALHVKLSLKSAEQHQVIEPINSKLEDVSKQELACEYETTKIHIFSNILDINEFDSESLCNRLCSICEGIHYFVCVSPNYDNTKMYYRNFGIDGFVNHFDEFFEVTILSERESNIGKWTRYEKIFKVNFDVEYDSINSYEDKAESVKYVSIKSNEINPDDLPF